MRKLIAILAGGLLGLGFLALMASPAGAELKTSISGSIRMMAHYTDRITTENGGSEEFGPTNVPFTAGPGLVRETKKSQTTFDARRTRLQLDMSDQVGDVKISGRLQTDFDTSDGNAGTTNSRHLRIRLGWGQWQTPSGWIVRFGQQRGITSEFGDNLFGGVGDIDTVEENGEWDQLQNRAAGVWVGWTTKMMDGTLLVGVGLEKAATNVLSTQTNGQAPTGTVAPAQGIGEDIPLFGAAARYRTPLWAVFLRGAAQKHRIILTAPKDGQDTAYTGWLGAISGEITPGPLRIFGQYWYADGLNRLSATYSDVALVGAGFATNSAAGFTSGQAGKGSVNQVRHLKGIETHNWHAGAEYKLTSDLKTSLSYEAQVAKGNRKIFDLSASSIDKRDFETIHANLIYAFWTRFDTGIEYQWGRVGTFGSTTGILNAINWRLRFYF